MTIATLVYDTVNTVNLPVQFRYRLPKPQRRISVKSVCGSSVIQEPLNAPTLDGSTISFSIEVACETDYYTLYDLFMLQDSFGRSMRFTFTGYWGDSYEVIFSELDEPAVSGRVFTITGTFTIICVLTDPGP